METAQKKKRNQVLYLALGGFNVLLHLLFSGKLEYHRDELLYFSLGMHPDFGYASVPPLIGWIAAVMQQLFGYSVFAVKLFPALLSGVFVMLAMALARELGGKTYACLLTGVALIFMPVNLRVFHLFQPVPLDLFFWTLLFYLLIRYAHTRQDRYLLWLGAVSGLALLNKYLVVLLLLLLLLFLFFSPHRQVFGRRAFYLALLTALVLFLPNLLWQLSHGLPVVGHMQQLQERQLVHVQARDFLVDQVLMLFAAGPVAVAGLLFLWKHKSYRFLSFTVLAVVLVLLLLRGKSYYTIGVFPVLVAAGAVSLEKAVSNKVALYAIPVLVLLLTLPILPMGMPVFGQEKLVAYFKMLEDRYGMEMGRRFEDGTIHSLPQDYADQLGWQELTALACQAYRRIPEKPKGLIYCENYGQAGAIAVIGKKYGLPAPLSFHESFAYWIPRRFEPDIEYLVYINDGLGEDIRALFQNIDIVGRISNPHAREYGTTVYLCSQPRQRFNAFWKTRLARLSRK